MLILLCAVIGFFSGLLYIIIKRKIRLEEVPLLIITALMTIITARLFRNYFKRNFHL
ncbi:MAG: hypothetical protein NC914_00175 [Candidatus Omnitrophica bacterium]|nr:hypothetical protein [Candidatus Omnitrophota bacterium]